MTVFVGKAIDLVFHAGAITWTHTFNFSGEHGAAVKARANDVVGAFVGVRDPARHLRGVHVCPAHEAENRNACFRIQSARHAVPWLLLALTEVDGAAIQARRRTRFQAPLWQLEFFQTRRQTDRRRITRTAGRIVF